MQKAGFPVQVAGIRILSLPFNSWITMDKLFKSLFQNSIETCVLPYVNR